MAYPFNSALPNGPTLGYGHRNWGYSNGGGEGMAAISGRIQLLAPCFFLAMCCAAAPAQFLPSVPEVNNLRRIQAVDPPGVSGPGGSQALSAPRSEAAPLAPSPAMTTLTQPTTSERPLPGSTEDQYQRELNSRQAFQSVVWNGTLISAFPNTLIWEPPLAVLKDPRMRASVSNLVNYKGNWSLDTWIGGTQGLFRIEPLGGDTAFQIDIFGLVQTRLTPDDLIAADYRYGIPLSFRWGWWHGKIGYEHTSAHIGDEFLKKFPGTTIPSYSKDEIVLGFGRSITDNWRVYGHLGYALQMTIPGVENSASTQTRYDIGTEWYLREACGPSGTPFAACNFEWRGDQGYETNITLQAGWMWRNPYSRLGQFRVFVEHYKGRSMYGQFSLNTESYTSVGLAFDY